MYSFKNPYQCSNGSFMLFRLQLTGPTAVKKSGKDMDGIGEFFGIILEVANHYQWGPCSLKAYDGYDIYATGGIT